MIRKFLTITAAMLMALAMVAAPASAHPNSAADRFVGPTDLPEQAQGAQGHEGIQCGAQNDNTPLQPLGLTCKADQER